MSNAPRKPVQRKPAAAIQSKRPAGELRFAARIAPPDGDRDADGRLVHVDLVCDLRRFTLAERQLVKRSLAKFVQPPDWDDVIVVHCWVVWRRTHPDSSLQRWMTEIEFGDLMDGLNIDPGHVEWDTTPEGYDPEV